MDYTTWTYNYTCYYSLIQCISITITKFQKGKKSKKKCKSCKDEKTTDTKTNLQDNEDGLKDQSISKQTESLDIASDGLTTKTESTSDEEGLSEDELYDNTHGNASTKSVDNSREVYGPTNLIDDSLPDMLLKVRDKTSYDKLEKAMPSTEECENAKKINWGVFTSTWLSVSAKNIDIRQSLSTPSNTPTAAATDIYHRDLDDVEDEPDFIKSTTSDDNIQPFCDEVPTSLLIPDHLEGVKMRRYLHMASESGLKEALQGKYGGYFYQ